FGVDEENPRKDGILAFIMWVDIIGLASQTSRVLQVVANNLHFKGIEDPRKSFAVTQ
ncbi:16384_t:CDS:1, partial [Cetraspora pellucida]